MRDTSTLFKLCTRALLELTDEDRDVIIQLAYALMDDGKKTNEHSPAAKAMLANPSPVPYDYGGEAYKSVMRERRKRKKAAKSKSKAKDFDATAALAAHANKTHTPHGNEKHGPTRGLKAKVMDTLTQTTGKVTCVELAEVLDEKSQRISAVLSEAFAAKLVKREAGKTTLDSGKVIPVYYYWLEASK